MRLPLRGGGAPVGGGIGHPPEQLYQEVAYLAYYLHWPHSEIMALDHPERRRWVEEVASINRRLNDDAEREA
jgi:hypothetical protein